MAVGSITTDEKVTWGFLGIGFLVSKGSGCVLMQRRIIQQNSPNRIQLQLDRRIEVVVRDVAADERVIEGFLELGLLVDRGGAHVLGKHKSVQ